ncbi:unnamed protein product [Clavelina lepadiformis]|uniref:EGF-like domain-containing protein n=1 Tax=Clavelina lepadiformis TaxID=159417 RepID=A0ABP0F5J5_CLALP
MDASANMVTVGTECVTEDIRANPQGTMKNSFQEDKRLNKQQKTSCCSGANRVCLHHPNTHTYSCPCKYGYHEVNGNCVQISVSCGTPCSTHGQCYGASNGCTSCVSAYYPNTYKCCCKYDQRCIHVTGAYYCLDDIDRPTIPPIP